MINEASTITVVASAPKTVNKRVTSTVAMNTERLWLDYKTLPVHHTRAERDKTWEILFV